MKGAAFSREHKLVKKLTEKVFQKKSIDGVTKSPVLFCGVTFCSKNVVNSLMSSLQNSSVSRFLLSYRKLLACAIPELVEFVRKFELCDCVHYVNILLIFLLFFLIFVPVHLLDDSATLLWNTSLKLCRPD